MVQARYFRSTGTRINVDRRQTDETLDSGRALQYVVACLVPTRDHSSARNRKTQNGRSNLRCASRLS